MRRRTAAFVATWLVFAWATTTLAAEPSVVERDRRQIRAHLAQVEQFLRNRDVSHLSPELREAREQNLDRLRAYRQRGEFPRNTHTNEERPVFIDRDGTHCAVGYLMKESGWAAEARHVADRENLAYLPDMQSPEVEAWVARSGLTAREASLVQPTYSPCNGTCSCDPDPVCGDDSETYINECFARNCGGVQEVEPGCCEPNDEIVSGHDDQGSFPGAEACDRDPDDRSAELCPEPGPDADTGTTTWSDAGSSTDTDNPADPDPEPACSTTDPSPTPPLFWTFALVGLVAAYRRRH